MKHIVLALVAVGIGLFGSALLLAQRSTQPQEIYKILGISVEGNSLADPSAIIANTGLKVGDEFVLPGDQIGSAIRKLWSLKIFDDVQIAIDRKLEQGVYLVVKVHELPKYD